MIKNDLKPGQRFGRLAIISKMPSLKWRSRYLCKCDCGNETIATRYNLIGGHTKSCGCLRADKSAERATIHGESKSDLFTTWGGMMDRCYNPNCANYERYGGRGIQVCDEWRRSPARFAADMGPRPSKNHTVDRKDSKGNYEPGNCRWATKQEQSENMRNNVRITFKGQTRTVSGWARFLNIPVSTIQKRLKRGWDPERAIAVSFFEPTEAGLQRFREMAANQYSEVMYGNNK